MVSAKLSNKTGVAHHVRVTYNNRYAIRADLLYVWPHAEEAEGALILFNCYPAPSWLLAFEVP